MKNKIISLDGYMTQGEAATELGVKKQRIFTLCDDGRLGGLAIGKTIYPSRKSVALYKDSATRKYRPLHPRGGRKKQQ